MKQSGFKLVSWITILALLLMLAPVQSAQAADGGSGSISLTTLGSASTQNFNTLVNSGSGIYQLTINGWYLSETGSSNKNDGQYSVGTGSSNTGDTYSFGASGSAERAFGTLLSGTLKPAIGAQFTNNTGSAINVLTISYTGEMWRAGVLNRNAADRLDFQLSTDATSLSTGTWANYDSLDFNSPNLAANAGALSGNSPDNQSAVSFAITGLNIPNGSSFWVRWADWDISSSDDGLAIDDFSITPGIGDQAPEVADTYPDDGATDFPTNANLTVTFSEPVNVTSNWFTLKCSFSGPDGVATSFSGGPTSFTLDPGVTLVHGETCTLTVLAGQVTDQDGNDPPDNMVMDFTVGFTAYDVCVASYTPIPAIQGSGLSAAITGLVTTKGVVVGDFEGAAAGSGFFLQDLNGDDNPATSDGIFVYTGSSNLVSVGQVVRVTGYARERFNQTTLNGSNGNSVAVPAANIVPCGTGSVAPTDVSMPFESADFPERYEGMLVRLPQPLVIAEYFNYERYGEIVLALPLDGEPRPFTGTAVDLPGEAANARTLANSLRRITLDDVNSSQNPAMLRHPNGQPFSLSNLFRGGDIVQNTVGVLGYDFSLYRIFPTAAAEYTAVNPRPAAPETLGGSVRVAAMNTLNFFVTLDALDDDSSDKLGDNVCGGNADLDCRGADLSQPLEFTRQRDKLLQALTGLNADVIGLNELENTPNVEPLASIVSGLPGYAYIDTGTIGSDAIKVGMIYRPAVVTPVGSYQVLDSTDDPRFIDTKSRPSLAQTFEVNASGAKFTLVVNHFKSKGSACDELGDPDLGDGQGNCSQTRRAAAEALVDWLATDPTGSGDPDFIIMGDLNSYAMEDTVTAIKAGPDDVAGTGDDFTNLIDQFHGPYAYSYTFDGQAGYLDHALASPSLVAQVTGAVDWHINSDESDVLDYDTSFKPAEQEALYEVNANRTSDHDPVVVGLELVNLPPTAAAGGPYSVVEGSSVTVSATGADPEGTAVTFAWDLDNNGTFETPGQSVSYTPPANSAPNTLTIKVQVSDAFGNASVAETTVAVLYNFTGFFQPVDNLPTINAVKAGQAVPVKFSLNGNKGLNIFAAGSPNVTLSACATGTVDTIETTLTAGNSSLSYDPLTGQYIYVWKTNKAWAGKCGILSVSFIDGTTRTALFKFAR